MQEPTNPAQPSHRVFISIGKRTEYIQKLKLIQSHESNRPNVSLALLERRFNTYFFSHTFPSIFPLTNEHATAVCIGLKMHVSTEYQNI